MNSMKRSFLFFMLLAGLTTACKTSGSEPGEEIDPRDQYVGVYDTEFTGKLMIGTNFVYASESGKGTITVTKSTVPQEIYLETAFPGNNEKLTAELNGAQFTIIDKKSERLQIGQTTVDGEYKGTGSFGPDRSIAFSISVQAQRDGVTFSRTGEIKGPRK